MNATCGCAVEHYECSTPHCDAEYHGPNCGHVEQPTPIAACSRCGQAVCDEHADEDGRCYWCQPAVD